MSNLDVTDWHKFDPSTPDEVLLKIENLLKLSTEKYQDKDKDKEKEEPQPAKRRGRAQGADKAKSTVSRGGRKDEKQEDQELLAQEQQLETKQLVMQPPNFVGQLRDYQIEGLRWMVELYETGVNGILADEMGLGKTAQTISLLAYLNDIRGVRGKHLIIVPKSTMSNWAREFSRFYPSLNILSLIGTKDERPLIIEKFQNMM
eukprot:UN01835